MPTEIERLRRIGFTHVLGLGAILVVGFNLAESILHGFLVPSLVFIGVTVLSFLWRREPSESAGQP